MKKEYVVPEVNSVEIKLEVMIATSSTPSDTMLELGGEADADSPALSRKKYHGIWETEW